LSFKCDFDNLCRLLPYFTAKDESLLGR